jgi:hypothetical protein
MGFGASAKVLSPRKLANSIYAEFVAARDQYAPRLKPEPLKMTLESRQPARPAAARRA